jgi:hypothetical protein
VLWSNGRSRAGRRRSSTTRSTDPTAKLDWQYSGTGNSPTFSDAQHLPNGNFLATCSQSGAVHEIDPTQKLVQSFANLSKGLLVAPHDAVRAAARKVTAPRGRARDHHVDRRGCCKVEG